MKTIFISLFILTFAVVHGHSFTPKNIRSSSRNYIYKERFTTTANATTIHGLRGGNNVANMVVKAGVNSAVSTVTGKDQAGGLTRKELVLNILALLSVGFSIFTIILDPSYMVTVVGVLCSLFAPTTALLQRKITDLETMRELNNQMRESVNILEQKNKQLLKQNIRLEESTKKLKKAETALGEISSKQGLNVDTLVKQVEEYRQIQAKVQSNLRSKIRQNLLSVLMVSDVDDDYVIDPEEVDVLLLRLSSIPGVKVNESSLRSAIKKCNGSIKEFSKKHLSDQAMDGEKLFIY